MIQNDFSKQKHLLKNLILDILYLAKEPVAKVKLAKLVLFAEIEHYKRTGSPITGLYFVRMQNGPVIAFWEETLTENEGTYWKKEERPVYIRTLKKERTQQQYTPLEKKAEIPNEVRHTVESIIKRYGKKTGTALSALAHGPAWHYSEPNEPLYVSELAIEDEKKYFALSDLIEEEFNDEPELAEKVSSLISRA